VVARVRRRGSGIKRQLLDQTLVSGVGNIYADEALWRARIHGERPGDRLTRAQVVELLGHARDVMTDALAQGGTSFDALYVNVNGESGYFDRSLHAYGREGEPCDRCGRAVRRVAFMNRSSYFCPGCQPVPRATRRRS
jgi:formamidopyrimidine-DNA glycosylase